MRGTVCKRIRRMVREEYPGLNPFAQRILYKAAKKSHHEWRKVG